MQLTWGVPLNYVVSRGDGLLDQGLVVVGGGGLVHRLPSHALAVLESPPEEVLHVVVRDGTERAGGDPLEGRVGVLVLGEGLESVLDQLLVGLAGLAQVLGDPGVHEREAGSLVAQLVHLRDGAPPLRLELLGLLEGVRGVRGTVHDGPSLPSDGGCSVAVGGNVHVDKSDDHLSVISL